MLQMTRRGLAVLRMGLRENTYFGLWEILGNYLLRLIQLLVMLTVWRALFAGGAGREGMTLAQLLCYTVLGSALQPLLDVRTQASNWLHDGSILSLYQRPMGIFSQLALQTAGSWLLPLLLYGLPVAAGAALLGLSIWPRTGWALPSLLLSISQGFAVDFLFACLVLRARNIAWPIHSLRNALTLGLSGAVIPFSVLPWNLGAWMQYAPLGTLAGAPLSLWVGLADPGPVLLAQCFWNLTLWPAALYFFRRSQERMVSYGG